MVAILVVMWAILGFLSHYFFTVDNLFEIGLQAAVIGIIAAGETFVILSGGIDLSVGSVFACSAVVGGLVLGQHGKPSACPGRHGCLRRPVWAGQRPADHAATGPALHRHPRHDGGRARLRAHSDQGVPIYGLSPAFRFIGQGKLLGVIPVPTVIVAVVFIVAAFVANYSRFGRFIYAIGSNTEASRLSGIRVGTSYGRRVRDLRLAHRVGIDR